MTDDDQDQPWEPAGLPTFGLGDRVRVDLGECRHLAGWHGTIEQDATGVICSDGALPVGAPPDHVYGVWFDRPIRGRLFWQYSRWELRPFDVMEALGQRRPRGRPQPITDRRTSP